MPGVYRVRSLKIGIKTAKRVLCTHLMCAAGPFVALFTLEFAKLFLAFISKAICLTLHLRAQDEMSSLLAFGDAGNSGWIVIWENPWELKKASTCPWISVKTSLSLYMTWPVRTKVPGVKVQMWNSWRARIPGNFWRRNFLSRETSTFPEWLFVYVMDISDASNLELSEAKSDKNLSREEHSSTLDRWCRTYWSRDRGRQNRIRWQPDSRQDCK